jgi:sigma-B regulation protein RsbU (phosphoserine phosphatase)
LLPNLIIKEDSLIFEPGDVLVCYSDGVTDAVRPGDHEMYGLARLQQIITREAHQPAKELADIIIKDIDEFRAGEEQPDDLTLLVTKAI